MSLRPFQHIATGSVTFAAGASTQLAGQRPLKKLGRVCVITDAGVAAAGLAARVADPLGDKVAFVDEGTVPDADTAHVDQLAARVKEEGVEALVAVGGGSVIDTAKAVAAAVAKGVGIGELEGFATVRAKLMPIVAVPTTAGTGAESTQFVVVKDHKSAHKVILADHSLVPSHAVLDPELCADLPAKIAAATGVDALTHATEALVSKMAHPVGDALALHAIRLIGAERALERSLAGEPDARGQMLIAANLAGQAISTSMLGACHAFAHALGALKGVPHGVANGLFLADTMRLNFEKAKARYAMMGQTLGGDGSGPALAEHALAEVERLVHEVAGIPRRLSEVGVVEGELDKLADLVMLDPDLGTNPVTLTDKSQVLEILQGRL